MGPGIRAPIHRILRPPAAAVLVTIGALLSVVAAVAVVDPLSAQTGQAPESVSCPTMTDSVDRLYQAYFNRPPDGAEFRDATGRYRSGQASLQALSSELADSEEFRTRYGSPDNERFVDLVYRNVLRREAEPADRDFWIASLDSGYPRGSVMIAFTESEEFVRRTGTATPLAGYLRWYPEGVHWYCGVGPRAALDIKPLEEPRLYADFMFYNVGQDTSPVGLQTLLDGHPHVTIGQGSLPPGFSDYKWGGLFGGDGNYGTALAIDAGPSTSWIAVFYPSSIGDQRLGWQLES